MRRRYGWVLFSLFFLVSPQCFGQSPGKRAISGYIREDGTGHVLKSVRIELQNSFGTPIANAYSDGNGAYEFDNLGGGDFYLFAQRDGYESSRQFVQQDESGHIYLDVYMRISGAGRLRRSGDQVSEHQLGIPDKALEFFNKGVQLLVEKSDYRGAVALFVKAIAKYPSYYEAYAAMGVAQDRMGDAAAAELSLRKSIRLSLEKYPRPMMDLASMYNTSKRFSDAEPLLRKAIALDAKSWRAQFELAIALDGQQRFKEAITSASTAHDLKPDNPQTYLLLYNLHVHADDLPAALQDSESYLKLVPDGATSDQIRRMQQQLQKEVQSSASAPVLSSDGETAAAPAESPVAPAVEASPTPQNTSLGTPEDTSTSLSDPNPTTQPEKNSVIPLRVDEFVPEVTVNVPCSLSSVLRGAGQRAEQFLNTLQKFDASERVEHYKLNAAGRPGYADVRSFDYVVLVSHDPQGGFLLEEYRNGGIVRPSQFPSGIVTSNLSVHALIFHPRLSPDFSFACEGLGEWKGHPAWLVHFEEKQHQLNPFRTYVIDGSRYPVQLTGRAWIDAGTYQVVRLESDLLKSVEKIHLTREHIAIEFASVQFRTRNEQLWLPQTADIYVEWNGRRFYRRHTFSNFRIFSTDSAQELHTPKESYCFTNTTDLLITGVLNATPVSGKALQSASLTLTIPGKSTVCKSVGAGKDLDLPVDSLASATFAHDGPAGSVEADAYMLNRGALELIPNSNVLVNRNP